MYTQYIFVYSNELKSILICTIYEQFVHLVLKDTFVLLIFISFGKLFYIPEYAIDFSQD